MKANEIITVFVPSMGGGGAERSMLNLATGIASKGHHVDLVLSRQEGPYLQSAPQSLRVVTIDSHTRVRGLLSVLMYHPRMFHRLLVFHLPRMLRKLPGLISYLRKERPRVLISALHHCNLAALCARECIGLPDKVFVSERNPLSSELAFVPGRKRYLLPFIQLLYPKADKVIAISKGVAEDLALTAGLRHEHIRTIYNPIMTPGLYELSKHDPGHPWFDEKEPPVILSIGRLTPQKDFPTLFKAFARARKKKRLRLIILGDGDLRAELEGLSRDLEICEDVAFMGFVDNPYSYAARASLFVLSSAWEGFGNVVVEALACGCPVVSTDCPGGPAEILDYGKYGTLVPVGDDKTMAEAIVNSINREHDRERLRERAGKFSIEASVNAYMALINGH